MEEMTISSGLMQGDLTPFCINWWKFGREVRIGYCGAFGIFYGYQIHVSKVLVSHLQYEDDTLFIGEACMENLLSMKALLRSFKLMSSL
jgi:hypothetical protein